MPLVGFIDMETWRIVIPIVVLVLCTIGEWFDALIYQDYNTKHLYVRDRKDFFDKFVKLLDWENGTKESGQC